MLFDNPVTYWVKLDMEPGLSKREIVKDKVQGVVASLKLELKQKQKYVDDLKKDVQQYSKQNERIKVSTGLALPIGF